MNTCKSFLRKTIACNPVIMETCFEFSIFMALLSTLLCQLLQKGIPSSASKRGTTGISGKGLGEVQK